MTTDTGRLTPEQDTALHTLTEELRALNHADLKGRFIEINRTIRARNTEEELSTFEDAQLRCAHQVFVERLVEENDWDEEDAENYADEILYLGGALA